VCAQTTDFSAMENFRFTTMDDKTLLPFLGERVGAPSIIPVYIIFYSISPIAHERRLDAEWLFPQEKAT
jgi:hypothetical protein